MADGQSGIDDTATYYSVDVPSAKVSGYFRIGDPDDAVEANLPDTPTPGTVVNGANFASGIVLYTSGHYQVVTPVVSTWSGDSLSVTKNGSALVSASYTLPSQPLTMNFQMQDVTASTIGNLSNFIAGNQLAYWIGNSASTGVGGLLWSNFGVTQNVFGGQVVNVINNSIDVQGWAEAKLSTSAELLAQTGIDLLVSPTAVTSAPAILGRGKQLTSVIATITALSGTAISDVQTSVAGAFTSDPTKMRDVMIASFAELSTVTAAVLVLQAMVALAGLTVSGEAEAARAVNTAAVKLADGRVTVQVGATSMIVTANGIYFSGGEIGFGGLNLSTEVTQVQHLPA